MGTGQQPEAERGGTLAVVPQGGCRGRVLVVAEDAAVRRSLVMLLRSSGFQPRAFDSAALFLDHALAAAAAGDGAAPCCLLVDHQQPGGMDGLGLVERMAAAGAGMPAIVIAGEPGPGMRRRAQAAGVIALVAKPLLDDAVIEAVAEAARRARDRAAARPA